MPFLPLLVFLLFSSCTATYRIGEVSQFRQRIDEEVREDREIEAMLASYRTQLATRMDSVIALGGKRLVLGKPESPLGNLLADALLVEARASFGEQVTMAVINQGGIRLDGMPQGPLTQGYFFELLPFENQVVIVALDSAGMHHLLRKIARVGGWPIAGDCRLTIRDTTIVSIEVKGVPLDGKKTYPVAMPDYLANGGDECAFLRPFPRQSRGELLRDMIIRYAIMQHRKGVALDSGTDGRIRQIANQ